MLWIPDKPEDGGAQDLPLEVVQYSSLDDRAYLLWSNPAGRPCLATLPARFFRATDAELSFELRFAGVGLPAAPLSQTLGRLRGQLRRLQDHYEGPASGHERRSS